MFITPRLDALLFSVRHFHCGAIIYNLPNQIIQSVLPNFHHDPPGTPKVPSAPQIGMVTKNTPQFQGSELLPL